MRSRLIFAVAFCALGWGTACAAPETSGFTFAQVIAEARELAARPAAPVPTSLPAPIDRLSYDSHRDIRFRPDEAIWHYTGSRFTVQLFHLGSFFRRPVQISLVDNAQVRPLNYSASFFTYPRSINPTTLPGDLGFAGFRLHYPINRPDYHDEVIAFLGATYFRAVGRDQVYGASVRGLAIDTGLPRPEEFPAFTKFWLVRPAAGDEAATVFGLLESESLTGAYRFVVHPGRDTAVDVEARLFTRRPVELLGIAPITSMFLAGKANPPCHDYRPEIHDSDCLLLANGSGEWILRPLTNPPRLSVSRFTLEHPRGFGLLQRETRFDAYQDLEAKYQLRPSIWVEPRGDWGRGWVQLVEAPAAREFDDNVNAFWVSDRPVRAGEDLAIAYRLHFSGAGVAGSAGGNVLATRVVKSAAGARFFVDFAGGLLDRLAPNARPEPVITASRGKIQDVVLERNPYNRSWRVFFDLSGDGAESLELRGFLRQADRALTETWSYPWRPS